MKSTLLKAYCRTYQFFFAKAAKLISFPEQEVITGSYLKAAEMIKRENRRNVLFVCGAGFVKRGTLAPLLKRFDDENVLYEVFSNVEADPSVETAEAIAAIYREKNCEAIIAIGGGSPMDAAKAACALIANKKRTLRKMRGYLKVRKPTPFLIAIPTTAGTGSETSIACVVTDRQKKEKFAVTDPVLTPKVCILDCELTLSLPKDITAQTGMDALTHAVEAYLNERYKTPQTDSCAKKATELILKYLPKAAENAGDIAAREAMLTASFLAGKAFTRAGVGNIHALSHAIGAEYHIAHGLANAVILPYVLADYASSSGKRLAELYLASGGSDKESTGKNAAAFINEIRKMNRALDIPEKLPEIHKEDIPRLAEHAAREANPSYAVPVVYDKASFISVLEKLSVKTAAST